ncbi:MAG: Sec-independent protein translocase protein TatB [Pseudobdellovibrionaceae bacterium]
MFGLGFTEILVIAVIAIVFIGPDQLPDLARTIGRFLNDLKRSTDSLKDDFKNQINLDFEEHKKEIFSDHHQPSDPPHHEIRQPELHHPTSTLPHTREYSLDHHEAPHETDPMMASPVLSDRQNELNQLELFSEQPGHDSDSPKPSLPLAEDTDKKDSREQS